MSQSRGAAYGDQARVSVLVAVEPELAFQVFTEDIDLWWRRGLEFVRQRDLNAVERTRSEGCSGWRRGSGGGPWRMWRTCG